MASKFANAVKGLRPRAVSAARRLAEKLTSHSIGKAMNTRIAATFVLALASVTGVQAQAERQFAGVVRIGDAAAVFRAHPAYQAPEALRGAIRAALRTEGNLDGDRPVH
jgi:hypothetical protein